VTPVRLHPHTLEPTLATAQKSADDLKVISPVGRAAFVHVFEPHAFEAGKEPNYSLILAFPEETDLDELKKTCTKAAVAKFPPPDKVKDKVRAAIKGGDYDEVFELLKLRAPWRDGADYADYGEPFVAGSTFITIKTKQAPGVVDERAKPIMNQMDFYAGCQARASFLCWAYDSMGNKGVTLLLNNVQKCGDGERLSGRQSAEQEFEPIKGAKGKGGSSKGNETADDDDDDIPF
jgi:hypothetical protein